MKPFLPTIAALAFTPFLFAQQEFETSSEGLMYPPETMSHLRHIVDSLNLKYKSCELNRVYASCEQAIVHYVRFDPDDHSQLRKDLKAGIPYDEVILKHNCKRIQTNLVAIREETMRYSDKQKGTEFNAYTTETQLNIEVYDRPELLTGSLKGQWVWEEGDYITAFYFTTDFVSQPLKEKYARMVQYSDCMVDTNAMIMSDNTTSGYYEELPDNYASLPQAEKEQLLEKLRRTSVRGYCSQDEGPRMHARNIAIMAAETVNWGVFLRAHLNIMNDRFERNASSSIGDRMFHTYIGELEALDIDVQQLLLGISLRIENPAEHHYYGSIDRVGRALSETKYADAVETAMIAMIGDPQLDNFNRIVIYYLFENYTGYLPEGERKTKNEELLKTLVWEIR